MHSDVSSKRPPGRRHGAVVLVMDTAEERVVLVKPTYKHEADSRGWQLPGGGAHQGEYFHNAADRELAEETGLFRKLTHALVIDQVPANPERESAEGLNLVFDGDTLAAREEAGLRVPDCVRDELSAVALVPVAELEAHCYPYQARRIRQAVAARKAGMSLPVLVLGEPVWGRRPGRRVSPCSGGPQWLGVVQTEPRSGFSRPPCLPP